MRTRQATAQTARQTLQQRGAEATRELREVLHLPANPDDTAILGTALARAAAREASRNSQFAREVLSEYDELLMLRVQTARRSPEPLEPLIPLRHTAADVEPLAPPDPRVLMYVYGPGKLARALHEYSLDKLKQTAERIQQEHPGTRPASRARKDAVIAYIVEHSEGNGR